MEKSANMALPNLAFFRVFREKHFASNSTTDRHFCLGDIPFFQKKIHFGLSSEIHSTLEIEVQPFSL